MELSYCSSLLLFILHHKQHQNIQPEGMCTQRVFLAWISRKILVQSTPKKTKTLCAHTLSSPLHILSLFFHCLFLFKQKVCICNMSISQHFQSQFKNNKKTPYVYCILQKKHTHKKSQNKKKQATHQNRKTLPEKLHRKEELKYAGH